MSATLKKHRLDIWCKLCLHEYVIIKLFNQTYSLKLDMFHFMFKRQKIQSQQKENVITLYYGLLMNNVNSK